MRHNSFITLYGTNVIGDGFGGKKVEYLNPINYDSTVSIKSNDLKPKPSGLGYYRIITVMLEKNVLATGDTIEHDGVKYRITRKVAYELSFLEAFVGYEV